MPGIAIKIIGANYSASGLGKVTLKGSAVPVTAIAITGSNSITNSGQYAATLTPSNTTQKRVVWSITSGGSYASIDQNGVVTAKAGASNSSVTIKCASADNPSIYGTKTIRVSYVKEITAISISGPSSVTDEGQFSAALTPSDTTQTGLVWSISSGSSYASIDQNGLVTALDGASNSSVTIKCQSSAKSSVYATKTISVTKSQAQPETGLVTDGLEANFDAYGATSSSLTDTVNGRMSAVLNGTVGTNCIDINPTLDGNTNSGADWEKILNGKSQWTVEYVLHAPGWADSANAARDIIHEVGNATSNRICAFLGANASLTNGSISIRYNNNWKNAVFDNDTINAIDWSRRHTIQLTREPSATVQTYNLYVDGELLATATTDQAGTAATVAAKTVYLASKGERHVYAIRFYSKAISAAEALQNHNYAIKRYGK